MAVAGLDSSRAHRLSPTRSTRSWATPPATPASKDQSPYYTPLIRVEHPHRESVVGSQVSVRKSSWYTDDPEFSQRTYSPVHLQVPPEYHNQYHQKRGSATSLVEAVSLRLFGGIVTGNFAWPGLWSHKHIFRFIVSSEQNTKHSPKKIHTEIFFFKFLRTGFDIRRTWEICQGSQVCRCHKARDSRCMWDDDRWDGECSQPPAEWRNVPGYQWGKCVSPSDSKGLWTAGHRSQLQWWRARDRTQRSLRGGPGRRDDLHHNFIAEAGGFYTLGPL